MLEMISVMNNRVRQVAAILMMTVLVGLLLTAGCFGERIRQTDTVVYKTDVNGTTEWVTSLDTGMMDHGSTLIETADGGYLVAGSISNNPEGYLGHQVFPRLVRLDHAGTIEWDTVLNSTAGPVDYTDAGSAIAVSETPDRHILATTYHGFIIGLNSTGNVEQVRVLNRSGPSFISEKDRSILFLGEKISKFNSSGSPVWENPTRGYMNAFQAADGGYYIESLIDMENATFQGTTGLAANGSTRWNYTNESRDEKIIAFYEPSPGLVEISYLREDWNRSKGFVHPVLTRTVTFDKNGSVTSEKNLTASRPLTRSTDGGYAFISCPYGNGEYTSNDYTGPLHIAKLSKDGSLLWDQVLVNATGRENVPVSIIQTKDGGFAALVIS
jgi:hypothetical protein